MHKKSTSQKGQASLAVQMHAIASHVDDGRDARSVFDDRRLTPEAYAHVLVHGAAHVRAWVWQACVARLADKRVRGILGCCLNMHMQRHAPTAQRLAHTLLKERKKVDAGHALEVVFSSVRASARLTDPSWSTFVLDVVRKAHADIQNHPNSLESFVVWLLGGARMNVASCHALGAMLCGCLPLPAVQNILLQGVGRIAQKDSTACHNVYGEQHSMALMQGVVGGMTAQMWVGHALLLPPYRTDVFAVLCRPSEVPLCLNALLRHIIAEHAWPELTMVSQWIDAMPQTAPHINNAVHALEPWGGQIPMEWQACWQSFFAPLAALHIQMSLDPDAGQGRGRRKM